MPPERQDVIHARQTHLDELFRQIANPIEDLREKTIASTDMDMRQTEFEKALSIYYKRGYTKYSRKRENGILTEEKTLKILAGIYSNFIDIVIPSTLEQDYLAIDGWIRFLAHTKHPIHAIQIKSGLHQVREFRFKKSYDRLREDYGLLVVSYTDNTPNLKRQFEKELISVDGYF